MTLAGRILSTGNGQLKVANGFTSVDINNNSPFTLILDRIDVTTDRVGEITIIDTETLKRVEYKVSSGKIDEIHSQGVLDPADPEVEDDFDTIVYTPLATQPVPTPHNFGDTIT